MTMDSDIAYEQRVTDIVNHGLLAVLMSIGHRTKLYDALAAAEWVTSTELADRSGLNERYVREWLSAMACAKVIDYDPSTGRFRLPPSGRRLLTRAAGFGNMARLASMVGFLAPVEDDIVRCFRQGGGLGYDRYEGFARAMAIQSRVFIDHALLPGIIPSVPGLAEALESGIDVCDVGCGAGHAANVIAQAYPSSRVHGVDLLADNVELARTEAIELGLTNTTFRVQDAATMDELAAFDLVLTVTAIHDQAKPEDVLTNIACSLRPGGRYVCVDSHASSDLAENLDDDMGVFRYSVSTLHCMSVSLAYGGAGLGDCWGPPLSLQMMRAAGFATVDLMTPDWLEGQAHVYLCTAPRGPGGGAEEGLIRS